MPFAIGLYLPIHLSVPIMAGGLVRLFLEKRKYANEKDKEDCVQSGVLYTSGLIAGEGIVGIILAVFAVIKVGSMTLADKINLGKEGNFFGTTFSLGNIGGLLFFASGRL